MTARLTVRDLRVRVRGREVIRSVDLETGPGEVIALVGANGSGKTTLLQALAGLRRFDGRVAVDDAVTGDSLCRRVVAVFDGAAFYPRWSVAANIDYAANDPRAHRHPDVRRLLSQEILRAPASRLSAGQLRFARLVAAFAMGPALLLLDECMNDLDLHHREIVRTELAALARERHRLVIVTGHETDVFDALASRVCVMRGGYLHDASDAYRRSGSVRHAYASVLG